MKTLILNITNVLMKKEMKYGYWIKKCKKFRRPLLRKNWKNILIIEDDMIFVNYEEGTKLLDKLINKEYDVITLGKIKLDMKGFINTLREALVQFTSQLDETDTNLLNIRDEILGLINKLGYLLTLE